MEPTRNASVPLAAWFRRHGATVVRRLGRARLTRFLSRHSRGMWGEERAVQTFIHPERPTSNGSGERVQRTMLEECWRPSFALSLVLKTAGLTQPRALPRLLQHRAGPHRPTDEEPDPLADARRSEDDEAEMTTATCRCTPEAVRSRSPGGPSRDRSRPDRHPGWG